MIKILAATEFVDYLPKGGSTRPWAVKLSDNGSEVPYVVKLFTERDMRDQHPIFKEAMGNILASEFNLLAPAFALADMSPNFIKHTLDETQIHALSLKAKGLKFSTVLYDAAIVYSPALHKTFFKNYDFANLFAYDAMLYNIDRGKSPEKPNILIHRDDFMLIDHEQCAPFIDNQANFYDLINQKLDVGELDYPYQRHLCYPYLKQLRSRDKLGLFDEFEENLAKLNVGIVRDLITELTALDISCGYFGRIIEYLYRLKNNSHSFCNSLMKCIA